MEAFRSENPVRAHVIGKWDTVTKPVSGSSPCRARRRHAMQTRAAAPVWGMRFGVAHALRHAWGWQPNGFWFGCSPGVVGACGGLSQAALSCAAPRETLALRAAWDGAVSAAVRLPSKRVRQVSGTETRVSALQIRTATAARAMTPGRPAAGRAAAASRARSRGCGRRSGC